MFYSVDGKIVEVGGAFPERKLKSLTFETEGGQFPMGSTSLGEVAISSSRPNSIIVNYGDGTVITQDFLQDGNRYVTGFSLRPNPRFLPLEAAIDTHSYTDGFTGRRFVNFEFQNIEAITSISYDTIYIYGVFPRDINLLKSLISIDLNRVYFIENLDFNINKNLERLSLQNSTQTKLPVIPESIFSSNLINLIVPSVFDLTDNITSNFFKINQLSSTLKTLSISSSENQFLPPEIENLDLTDLYLGDPYEEMQEIINTQTNLKTLYHSSTIVKSFDMMSFSNLNKLGTLFLKFDRINLTELSVKWAGLKSLYRFIQFQHFIRDNQMFDEFVNQFYILCTNEASITEDANAFGGEYPHRFRDISWGHSSLAFTGTKQAPSGYVPDVSYGNPQTPGEKVWIMQNQLGHTITHA